MKLIVICLLLPLTAAFVPQMPVAQSSMATSISSRSLQLSPSSPPEKDSRHLTAATAGGTWLGKTGDAVKRGLAAGLLSLSVMTNLSSMMPADMTVANAAGSTVIGEISGSGLIFKDTLVGKSSYLSIFHHPFMLKCHLTSLASLLPTCS